MKKPRNRHIFSGDYSKPFWAAINRADNDLLKDSDLLYKFGLKAQEMESRHDKLVKLVTALKRYVNHLDSCAVFDKSIRPCTCTCGLEQALANFKLAISQ